MNSFCYSSGMYKAYGPLSAHVIFSEDGPVFGTASLYPDWDKYYYSWMPTRSTLAAGLIVAGFGGSAIIFNEVITAFINPDNLSPDQISETGDRYFTDPELLDRVPSCFLILGACYLTMTLIGVLGLDLPYAYKNQKSYKAHQLINHQDERPSYTYGPETQNEEMYIHQDRTEYGSVTIEQNNTRKIRDMTILGNMKLAFRTREFHILWVTVMALDAGYLFLSLYKAYGQTFIEDDHFLALVGSLSAIFNCVGRPFWGSVMDKYGYKVTLRCIAGIFATVSATIMFTEHMHRVFFLIWICILYFSFCGIWAVAPSTLSKLFGPNTMAINYGLINVARVSDIGPSWSSCFNIMSTLKSGTIVAILEAFASLVGGISALTIKDIIGWHGLFLFSAGLGFIPVILTFFFNGRDLNGQKI